MADFSATFLDFLKAYDSGAYIEVTSMVPDDPKAREIFEARKKEIYDAWKDREATWENVPLAIRDRFPGRPLPQDIMEASYRGEIATLRAMEYDASLKTAQEARKKVEQTKAETQKWSDVTAQAAIDVAVAAATIGYAADTCHTLALSRQLREDLLAKAGGDPHLLSDKDRKLWAKSREDGRRAILKDLRQNMPERMLLRMLVLHNRGRVDSHTFARDVAELIQRIETSGRQEHLLHLLHKQRFYRQIKNYSDETIEILKKNVLPYIPQEAQKQFVHNLQQEQSMPRKMQNVNERPAEKERSQRTVTMRINENVRTA